MRGACLSDLSLVRASIKKQKNLSSFLSSKPLFFLISTHASDKSDNSKKQNSKPTW